VAAPGLTARRARGEQALERTLFTGVTAFRWAAWIWMAIAFSVDVQQGDPGSPEAVARPGVGYVLLLVALAYTVWASLEIRRRSTRLDSAVAVGIDLTIAVALLALDPWIYESAHSQRLGANWAIASVLSAGIVFAGRGGFAAGLVVGVARIVGQLLWDPGPWHGDDTLAAVSGLVIYSLGGAVAGFFAIKLREAERDIAATQAREEVARTLHDGVLQTLAVIQRRSDDPELRTLARDQERDLRLYLAGATRAVDDLVPALRAAGAAYEQRHGSRAEVVTVGDLDDLRPEVVAAVSGAVQEGLTNAAKHGRAGQVTVYVERTDDGGLFCSVKDDGDGFDPAAVEEGMGLSRSVRGRIEEVGGTVEVVSRPGHGTELRIQV
jgi:signal transduction histidine kinase